MCRPVACTLPFTSRSLTALLLCCAAQAVDLTGAQDVRSIARLRDSTKLRKILADIEQLGQQSEVQNVTLDNQPVYKLTVEANNILAEIDSEIVTIHTYVRQIYSRRFPELEQLVRTNKKKEKQ